jgi:hypothetical protein
MIEGLSLVNNTNEVLDFKASFVNNVWYGVRNNKQYKIDIPKDILNRIVYIFSTPLNDHYPVGTCRKHEKLHLTDYQDFGFWSPFKDGITLKGVLIKDTIYINWKCQETVSKHVYAKQINTNVSKMSRGN